MLQDTVTEENCDSEDDDLLVVKARHEYELSDDVIDGNGFAEETVRHPKKIRVESRKSIKFGDDGMKEAKLLSSMMNKESGDQDDEAVDTEGIVNASNVYMEKVHQRLEQTKQLDKEEERERIRAKHKQRRLKEKAERGEEQARAEPKAVLQSAHHSDDEEESSSSPKDDSSAGSSSSESIFEGNSGKLDLTAREDIALALIRGRSM